MQKKRKKRQRRVIRRYRQKNAEGEAWQWRWIWGKGWWCCCCCFFFTQKTDRAACYEAPISCTRKFWPEACLFHYNCMPCLFQFHGQEPLGKRGDASKAATKISGVYPYKKQNRFCIKMDGREVCVSKLKQTFFAACRDWKYKTKKVAQSPPKPFTCHPDWWREAWWGQMPRSYGTMAQWQNL